MKIYLYVVALDVEQLHFRHSFVIASSPDEAYAQGFELTVLGPGEQRVNDYVVEIGVEIETIA